MTATPETLPRHELAGRAVRVVDATDPGRVDTSGTVVCETEGTLLLASDSGVTQVPKRGATFEFDLEVEPTDEAAGASAPGAAGERPSETAGSTGQSGGCESVASVTVDGDVLHARPARRTEQEVTDTWH